MQTGFPVFVFESLGLRTSAMPPHWNIYKHYKPEHRTNSSLTAAAALAASQMPVASVSEVTRGSSLTFHWTIEWRAVSTAGNSNADIIRLLLMKAGTLLLVSSSVFWFSHSSFAWFPVRNHPSLPDTAPQCSQPVWNEPFQVFTLALFWLAALVNKCVGFLPSQWHHPDPECKKTETLGVQSSLSWTSSWLLWTSC